MEINYTLDMEYGNFYRLLSFAEAAEIWKIDQSTLRKAVADGRLKPGKDCRKFGKQWVVTVDAMAREFRGGLVPFSQFLVDLRKATKNQAGFFTISGSEEQPGPKPQKSYTVYFWIKKNKHEYLRNIIVKAQSSREACKIAKEKVKEITGNNAFRPTTKAPTPEELDNLRENPYYIIP